jgi:exopolysaccharide biosynthesis WecB/TagA/CpsF family protein
MTTMTPVLTSSERLALHLAERVTRGDGATVTWLNHFSGLRALRDGIPLDEFDYLGVDGLLLRSVLRADLPRTTADLVLPALLRSVGPLRVALVGSSGQVLDTVARKIEGQFGHAVPVRCDGYGQLLPPAEMDRLLSARAVQIVIVGLGAPLQDRYSLAIRRPGRMVLTCGGWLDQFSQESYYPSWAYGLRLNWLVRLAKEPRRLWRRYTTDAAHALRNGRELREFVLRSGDRPLRDMLDGAATLERVEA